MVDTTTDHRISSPASTVGAGTFFEQHVDAYWLAQLLVRGIGPTLSQYGVTGVLAGPQLVIFGSAGSQLSANAGWGGGQALSNAFAQVYAFPLPANSADAAILQSISAGGGTAQVSGVGGSTGVALAEIYDADTGIPASNLVNLSSRALVGLG